jgi:hypothetical protein
MKQIFFKTVRKDGSSVWAIGKFKTHYEVGKTYKFPASHPAHVFLVDENSHCLYPQHTGTPAAIFDGDVVYKSRAERSGGSRVLICYGEVKAKYVPTYEIDGNWNLNHKPGMAHRYVSSNFTVIGEIKPKVVDTERTRDTQWRVIETPKINNKL